MRSTDRNAIATEIVTLLRKIVYAPDTQITADTRLDELGMDSLDLVEAGLELEAIVGQDLPEAVLTCRAWTIAELAAGLTAAPRASDSPLAA